MKVLEILQQLGRNLGAATRKRPLRMALFFLCLLLLIAVETWYHFAPLPAHDWIASNLARIRPVNPKEFSFAVFGDNKNSHTTFEKLLQQVDADSEITFAIDVGDLVFDGEKEKYRYFFKQVQSNLHLPLLTAIGNHELQENGRGLYYDIFGRFYYSFQVGRSYFIVLDDANETGLDRWQRKWLEGELEKAQAYDNRFVFMHVPLFDPRGKDYHHCLPPQEAKSLLALFRRYHISHIFASHIHGYYAGRWQGIPYTISGGAGAELAGTDPQHYFYHYLKVRVRGGAAQVLLRRLPSPQPARLERFPSIAWLYIYAFLRFHGIELALFLLVAELLHLALAGRPDE